MVHFDPKKHKAAFFHQIGRGAVDKKFRSIGDMKKIWAFFFLFLFAVCFPASLFAQTGSIYITSKPPGANISLDGNPLPIKTNILLQDIPIGQHKITLDLRGDGKAEKTVEVKAGLTSEINFDFQPEKPKEVAATPKKAPIQAKKGQPPLPKDPSKAIQPEPSSAMEFFTRGQTHLGNGQYDLAIADFTKALELGPEGKAPYQLRGVAHLEKNQYDLAIVDFSKAIEIDPKDPYTYDKRSLAYLLSGRFKPAVTDLKKAIDLDPKKAAPYYLTLGFASYKIGEKKEAQQFFLKAKDLDKDIIENRVGMLEKATNPTLKRLYVETIFSASQYLDLSSRVMTKAKEMGAEIPIPPEEESFLRPFRPWGILFIVLVLGVGILLILGILFLLRRRRKASVPTGVAAPEASVDKATPIELVRVARSEKTPGPREMTVVGNYQILEKIASGGMANIYKAMHINKGGMAVLKIPYEQFQNDSMFIDRFRREAELGRKLYNENIINIYESGTTEDGIAYIAMEYLEGIDLRRYLNEHGKVPIPEALKIITCVCRALDYAHIKGVIHRDIKPENIMLPHEMGEGRVVLMDFGVAHATYLCTLATRTTFIGTPYYMSPDQLSGEDVDGRSDIYSLGVVFFEMLTGQRPFKEKDPLKVLIQHQKVLPPRPSSWNEDIPPELDVVILRMLAKDPGDRYQSVEALLVDLQDYMVREGIEVI